MSGLLKPDWQLPRGVRAVMTTRHGAPGTSTGAYAAFNLGTHVGDDPIAVAANRRALVKALDIERIAWMNQVHGREVMDAAQVGSESPTADASFSRTANVACAVMVADCVPVLFAATDGGCVAAAHAGWRGLAGGVLSATLAAMAQGAVSTEGTRVTAWIGPTIGARQYEVDEVVRAAFAKVDHAHFRASRPGHYWLDLAALAESQLLRCGVAAVSRAGICVFERDDLFYSHRRDGTTGRCAALIWRTSP